MLMKVQETKDLLDMEQSKVPIKLVAASFLGESPVPSQHALGTQDVIVNKT